MKKTSRENGEAKTKKLLLKIFHSIVQAELQNDPPLLYRPNWDSYYRRFICMDWTLKSLLKATLLSGLLYARADSLFTRPVYIYWESVLFPGTIINETTFPNFQINIFYYSSYKITWQVDYIYKCMYVVFKPKKKIGKTRLIFIICLKGCNCCTYVEISPFFQWVEKFYLLFSSRTCLGLRPELH